MAATTASRVIESGAAPRQIVSPTRSSSRSASPRSRAIPVGLGAGSWIMAAIRRSTGITPDHHSGREDVAKTEEGKVVPSVGLVAERVLEAQIQEEGVGGGGGQGDSVGEPRHDLEAPGVDGPPHTRVEENDVLVASPDRLQQDVEPGPHPHDA